MNGPKRAGAGSVAPRGKSLQRKLAALNAQLAAIVEHTNDGIIGKDLDGLVTSWNEGAERIYGYTAEEMIGRPISLLAPPEQADEIPMILEGVRRGERISQFETLRRTKDGRLVPVSLTVSPIKNEEGEIVGASTIARDTTGRRKAEEALKRSEERLALALEVSRDGVWDWRVTTGDTYLSPKYYEMTGYAPGEAEPDLDFFRSLIHPDDVEKVMATMGAHLAGQTPESIIEYRMVTKTGAVKHVLGKGKVIERDPAGNPVRMIGTIADVTTLKEAQEQVRQAKEEWERTFDAMPDVVTVIDEARIIQRANKALAARLGRGRDEVVGTPCFKTICGLEEPGVDCPGLASIGTGKEHAEERFLAGLGGHYFVSCSPIPAAEGRSARFVEVCRDVSERRRMEERLREAAVTDPLTGLFNRRGFLSLARQHLKVAERNQRNVMLLFLDLDNMKEINDAFGHGEGDQALVDTADVLRATFRESDVLARMGGDEFAVLLTEPSRLGIEEVVVRHLVDNLEAHHARTTRPYRLSFSAGIASSVPDQAISLEELLATADRRMYEKKVVQKRLQA